MPFKPEFNGVWQTIIKEAVESINDECIRADDIFSPGSIINDIISLINQVDYFIADVSEQNPNVYYELGLAHSTQKPVILISKNLDTLPFDINNQRVIVYEDTMSGGKKLEGDLLRYLNNI